MKQLADGVFQLKGKPENAINVYVIGDVLIDAGTPWDRKRVIDQLRDVELSAHALTHAHFDHFGSSAAVCSEFGLPMWCGAKDVEAVETGKMLGPMGLMLPAARKNPIAKALTEGDEVAGFEVLDTPGHSPGHVSFWRESDRTLLCGDVMWGMNPFLNRGPIQEPFSFVSPDHKLNRESARRLAELDPALVCFGHGEPCRDTERFKAAVAKLPK
jgi:glyoxylase-like metal-dependent hydrolase (beta-lactamase superfamily II)